MEMPASFSWMLRSLQRCKPRICAQLIATSGSSPTTTFRRSIGSTQRLFTPSTNKQNMAPEIKAAKLLEERSHIVPGRIVISEYFFEVPTDWNNPKGSRPLTIFARAARRVQDKPIDPTAEDPKKNLPWLLFLQGGPGFECSSPQNNYWIQNILERGYQVLCLDQRGTGLSSPLTASSIGLRGDDDLQAQYVRNFRADSIVKDCEAIRKYLMEGQPPAKAKWTLMGQSFGGFCSTTYLSFYPEGLREVFMFGGLPPMVNNPDVVYKALFKKVIERNQAYYSKYPEDIERVQAICKLLQRFGDTTVRDTTSQGFITARRFLQLGIMFGGHGGLDSMHEIVLKAYTDLKFVGHLTRPTVSRIESNLSYNNNIIYAILHEPIYCQGEPSNWSCQRILDQHFSKEFAIPAASAPTDPSKPILFTGEMIFPHMLEDYYELQKLSTLANNLASYPDWPPLYDEAQLARNEVPVYCAVYVDDMYVDFDLSRETAGKIRGAKTYVTNVMYHDALRSRMDEVVRGVFALRDDCID